MCKGDHGILSKRKNQVAKQYKHHESQIWQVQRVELNQSREQLTSALEIIFGWVI